MRTPTTSPIRTLLAALLCGLFSATSVAADQTAPRFTLFGTVTTRPTPGVATPMDTLVTIDPRTGAQSLAGPVGAAVGVYQLDANPVTGMLVGTNLSKPGVMYQIDPATGAASVVANIGAAIHGVAFSPGGTLFGVDVSDSVTGDVLGTIDLQAQTFSPILTIERGMFVRSIDFAPSGLLYAVYTDIASQQQSLVVLDVRTRSVVSRTNLGTSDVEDIDYAPDGFIYHSNASFFIFRIDPANPIQVIIGAGTVGAGGGLASIPAMSEDRNTLVATADTYVRSGIWATTNFGAAPVLQAKKGASPNNTRRTYLKFDIGSAGHIAHATLRIYGHLSENTTANVETVVYAVPDSSWNERTLTWNTRTDLGRVLGRVIVRQTTPQWLDLDVSGFVRAEQQAGQTFVSFALRNVVVTSPYVECASRESGRTAPHLLITP